jgi:3-hydroxyacyl-[acyl-carrier-protein] dehydratase
MSIDNARFRKPVVPGDVVYLNVETIRQRGNVWKLSGKAMVDDQIVSEAVFAAMISDP